MLLPLLVLGVLAWLGVRAQVKAAWSFAREESKAAGRYAEEVMTRELTAAVKTTPLFPDPPVPGTASAADAVLDGNDLTSLRQLRDDSQAGISPAGLPRRVLAGFRVFETSGDSADAEALISLALGDAASVLTPLVFKKLGKSGEDWTQGEQARVFLKQYPEIASVGKWISKTNETWWLASDGKDLRFIPHAAFVQSLELAAKHLPPWASLLLSIDGKRAAGSHAEQEVMESLPVRFGKDLRLEITAAHPQMIEANARQQGRWTLALLGFAIVVSGSALFFIHRSAERERRLNAMKSDFVASVSHELRAPVASIRLMADALNAGKIEPHTVTEFHQLISREGARLTSLIENVLDFARIEQGRKRWHFQDYDLAAVIAETLSLMEPLAAEKSIALVSPKPLPSLVANVDPGAIQQALVNLLDNAIKFSPAGSTVEILLAENSPNWEIQITDQGPGIPASEHARVFEKFHRLGSELRRETQGTGIGLSLVKAVAEAHGGRVVLASAAGQGAVFTLIGRIESIL